MPETSATPDPDATAAVPLGTVVIRYPNLSGALVMVCVADFPKGSVTVSASPHLNRYAECAGCGDGIATIVRGVPIEQARKWAAKHSAECRALPQPDDGRRFDVTVRTTDGDTHTYRGVTNERARDFEDLPFTSSNVVSVDVDQVR